MSIRSMLYQKVLVVFVDHVEDTMVYGEGIEKVERVRKDAVRERTEKWARWLKQNPEVAADWADNLGAGRGPQHVPRE